MKVTKNQLKQIIKEEKKKLINEMNPDGTISNDEDGQRDDLLSMVELTMMELIQDIETQADLLGGSFRSPGIRNQCKNLMQQIIREWSR